ncbi:hypothetical protein SKAU_G00140020 [Synaphobranchus kaupii]|uniref:Uncharacterized protein n=1 Tax=Synaphobranchus kaupii TaxID=118154 RepID=A0A9Q1FS30_SYNKA|nr:hypothetical protein SKAU_G00140020 [Synaphobranchus kaupii]
MTCCTPWRWRGGRWASSSENLDEPEEGATRQRRKELGSLAFSTTAINYASLHFPASHSAQAKPEGQR